MKTSTRLTSKGQVVIPKPVRERLRWRTGVSLDVEITAEGAVLLAASASDAIERGFGFLETGDPLSVQEAEHRAELRADDRRRRGR